MSVRNRFALVLGLLVSASCSSPNPSYLGQDLETQARDLSTAAGPPAPDLSMNNDVDDLSMHHPHDFSGDDLAHHHQQKDMMRPPEDLAPATPDLGSSDPTHTCGMVGGGCLGGVTCGGACCGAGEWCDSSNTCRCGDDVACTGGNHCGGATLAGGLTCGSTCCGAFGGTACPL